MVSSWCDFVCTAHQEQRSCHRRVMLLKFDYRLKNSFYNNMLHEIVQPVSAQFVITTRLPKE
jgi:hypothetical protein